MGERFSAQQRQVFQAVCEQARKLEMRAFVVGGVVRDLFLGHAPLDKDIDFLIEGNAITLAESLAPLVDGELKRFDAFITAKIVAPRKFPQVDEIDLASARTEIYLKPGALPKVSLAPIQLDLKRRDFSINAMALPVEALIAARGEADELRSHSIDYFDGLADLDAKTVRVLHDRSFIDDPTRIFRAARYVERLAGSLDSHTAVLLESAVAAGSLAQVSEQRKLNEIKKVLEEEHSGAILARLEKWQVLDGIDACRGVSNEILSCWQTFISLPSITSKVDAFVVFTALCAATHAPEEVAGALKGYSCSKKALQTFIALAQFCRDGKDSFYSEPKKLGNEVLLAAFLRTSHDQLKMLLRERGLTV